MIGIFFFYISSNPCQQTLFVNILNTALTFTRVYHILLFRAIQTDSALSLLRYFESLRCTFQLVFHYMKYQYKKGETLLLFADINNCYLIISFVYRLTLMTVYQVNQRLINANNDIFNIGIDIIKSMNFFFKGNQKQQKQINGEMANHIKNQLKKKYCQVCDKKPSSKVAFGDGVKPVFTCPDCELKAVGDSIQKLSEKNLISNQKFSQCINKELIAYQHSLKNPAPQQKKSQDSTKQLVEKATALSNKIKEQVKILKAKSNNKMKELVHQSQQQNKVLIFEEVSRIIKQNKLNQLQNGRLILNKALVNTKGIYFCDQQRIENANSVINQKITSLKKANKIKLKELNDLIDQINSIQL